MTTYTTKVWLPDKHWTNLSLYDIMTYTVNLSLELITQTWNPLYNNKSKYIKFATDSTYFQNRTGKFFSGAVLENNSTSIPAQN